MRKDVKKGTSLFVLIWVFFCLVVGIRLLYASRTPQKTLETARSAQELLQTEKEKQRALLDEREKANTPFTQEKIIRDQLLLQKPGEIILVVPSPVP